MPNSDRKMTDAELQTSIRYLNGQLSLCDGETPPTEADFALARERDAYLREAARRGVSF
jgi:hypothetical protein